MVVGSQKSRVIQCDNKIIICPSPSKTPLPPPERNKKRQAVQSLLVEKYFVTYFLVIPPPRTTRAAIDQRTTTKERTKVQPRDSTKNKNIFSTPHLRLAFCLTRGEDGHMTQLDHQVSISSLLETSDCKIPEKIRNEQITMENEWVFHSVYRQICIKMGF